MRTKPPTFATSRKPLDADDWLRAIENKLDIGRCTNQEKVFYASHHLEGHAEDWWDNFRATQEGHVVTWTEFTTTFHEFFIPTGLMMLKKEFRELKQGNMSVHEYLTKFNQLS